MFVLILNFTAIGLTAGVSLTQYREIKELVHSVQTYIRHCLYDVFNAYAKYCVSATLYVATEMTLYLQSTHWVCSSSQ